MTYRCGCCGYASETAEFFREERIGVWRRPGLACMGCQPLIFERAFLRYVLTIPFNLVLGTALWVFGKDMVIALGACMVGAAFLLLVAPLTAAVHELGHALAASAVGMKVTRAFVGAGPSLVKFRIGQTEITLNADVRAGGAVQAYWPKGQGPWWGEAIFTLGGVSANAVAAAALLATMAVAPQITLLLIFLLAALASQVLTIVSNLWPRNLKRHPAVRVTDGMRLWNILRGRERANWPWISDFMLLVALMRERPRGSLVAEASAACERHPGSAMLLSLLIGQVHDAQGAQAGWDLYQARRPGIADLPAKDIDSARRNDWLSALSVTAAWVALRTEDPDLMPQACALAAVEWSDAPISIGSYRGAVMVANKQYAEGLPLLTASLRHMDGPASKADFCGYLAIAEREVRAPGLEADYLRLRDHLLAAA